jgi:GTP cyclohydrolase II
MWWQFFMYRVLLWAQVDVMPLQEKGLDTVDANRALGLPDDCREYTSVRNIIRDLKISSIKLIVRRLGILGVQSSVVVGV